MAFTIKDARSVIGDANLSDDEIYKLARIAGFELDPVEQNTGIGGDTVTDLERGALQVPGAAVGLADAALGLAGFDRPIDKATDWIGEKTGFQPGKTAELMRYDYSPQRQASDAAINQAWTDPSTTGLDIAGAYLANPRSSIGNVIQSLPAMLAGGLAGRFGLGLQKAAQAVKSGAMTEAEFAALATKAGAVGEGAIMAGQAMQNIDESVDPQKAGLAALGIGLAGGAIGYGSGRAANELGLGDIEQVAASGGAAGLGSSAMHPAKRVIAGAIQEGPIEEGMQSVAETGLQNMAENKPLDDGMTRNVVEGSIAGALMGGGVNAFSRDNQQVNPNAGPLEKAANTVAPVTRQPLALPELIFTADGQSLDKAELLRNFMANGATRKEAVEYIRRIGAMPVEERTPYNLDPYRILQERDANARQAGESIAERAAIQSDAPQDMAFDDSIPYGETATAEQAPSVVEPTWEEQDLANELSQEKINQQTISRERRHASSNPSPVQAEAPQQRAQPITPVQPAKGGVPAQAVRTGQPDQASGFVATHQLSDGTPARFNADENGFEDAQGNITEPDGYEIPLQEPFNVTAKPNESINSSTAIDEPKPADRPVLSSDENASIRKSMGPHYAAGLKAAQEGKPRALPSYFTKPGAKNAKDWLRGYDEHQQVTQGTVANGEVVSYESLDKNDPLFEKKNLLRQLKNTVNKGTDPQGKPLMGTALEKSYKTTIAEIEAEIEQQANAPKTQPVPSKPGANPSGNVAAAVSNSGESNVSDETNAELLAASQGNTRSSAEKHASLMQVNPVGESTTEFVVGEPRSVGGIQNYARFKINSKGKPVGIKYFYNQSYVNDAVKLAIDKWISGNSSKPQPSGWQSIGKNSQGEAIEEYKGKRRLMVAPRPSIERDNNNRGNNLRFKLDSELTDSERAQDLKERLRDAENELADQGMAKNARTRDKVDSLKRAIAEIQHPELLKALNNQPDWADAVADAIEYGNKDVATGTRIRMALKNKNIVEPSLTNFTDKVLKAIGKTDNNPEEKPTTDSNNAEGLQKAKPLYASRHVDNADEIIAWAKSQGFKATLPAADMHVTVAYSSKPMDGGRLKATAPTLVSVGGKRTVEPLGDQGAIVLKFRSDEMSKRWQEYRDAGASWDYDSYMPHITITYQGGDIDLSKVKPYEGKIILGKETQEELNPNKEDDYKEDALQATSVEESQEKPIAGVKPSVESKSAEMQALDAELDELLGDLGAALVSRLSMKAVPEDRVDILPIMSKIMAIGVKKGYLTFKENAKFVLDMVRAKFGDKIADTLDIDDLQAGYIAMKQGTTPKREVIEIESLDEINNYVKQESPVNENGVQNENNQQRGVAGVQAMDSRGTEAASGGRDRELAGRGGDADAKGNDGVLEGEQAKDVSNTGQRRNTRKNGSRSGMQDVGARGKESEVGDSLAGQPESGGTGLADDGTGRRGQQKLTEEKGRVDGGQKTGLGNYHIDNPELLIGGTPKVRFARNKKAIETYNTVIEEGREPTPEERDAMAAYIGWGSFGQDLFQGSWDKPVFRDGWKDENQWLRDHLGEQAWKSAQDSIINAHYTDPPTVSALWKIAERLGFKGGRVLEPSMGIGNFFGLMPVGLMEKSDLTGIELDDITGGMAKMLYPDANVQIKGYQDSKTADNFYDVIIGNWPFAAKGPSDRRYNKLNLSLHDYFFVKAIDQARPGGFVIGITSAGTMDKVGMVARYEMSKKANLVAAFRMPMGAFDKYAGTSVVADIIILQKHGNGIEPVDADWLDIEPLKNAAGQELTRRDGSVVKVNKYWAKHPDNVLGRMTVGHGTTQGRDGMIVERQDGYADVLASLADRLPKDIMTTHDFGKAISYISNNTSDRQNSITVSDDGKLYVVQGDRLALLSDLEKYAVKSEKETANREDQIKQLVGLRRAYGNLIDAEIKGGDNVESLRKTLNGLYQTFKKSHGTIAESNAIKFFKKVKDPFYPALAALEVNTGTAEKPVYTPAAILTRATTRSAKKLENPSISDAFILARNKDAEFIDVAEIAKTANTTPEAVEKELLGAGALFKTPSGNYQVRDIYLSGNVRRKLREALDAQESGMDMAGNIQALKGVLPKDTPYFAIEPSMGASWVPAKYYQQFIAELVGVTGDDIKDISVTQLPKSWKASIEGWINKKPEATTIWGVPFYPFSKLVNAAFNGQSITIRVKDSDGNEFVDEKASKEANEKAEKIREEFKQWIWKDAERRVDLEKSYNEILNAYASPDFDGSFMAFDGLALQRGDSPFNLRQHQVNAIWRGVANGRGLYAHEVGTGKTYTMGGIAIESRRYGVAKKPMIIAHNANSASVAGDIQSMYPASKVLYIDNLSPATIDSSMYQIANDDWDAVVIPHSLISRLVLSEKTLMDIAARDIMALEEEAIASAAEEGFNIADILDDEEALRKVRGASTAKELVKQRNAIITNIKKQAERASKENAITFENLGVDMLIVDESHEFKKPPLSTRRRVKGLNTSASGEGIALNFLTTYVRNINNGKGVHVFTGTPITNTLNEIYNQMRYVMGDSMDDAGVFEWDAWFNSFASIISDVELTSTGEYESVTRLAGFQNVPELRRFAGQYMDIVFADEMPEFVSRTTATGKTLHDSNITDNEREELLNGRTENPVGRPYKKVVNDTADMTADQKSMLNELIQLARMFKKADRKTRRKLRDHKSNPVLVETAAAQAGFDPRLIDMSLPDHPNYKSNRVVKRVMEHYREDSRATQVIFMEKGYNDHAERSIYDGSGFRVKSADGKSIKQTVATFNVAKDLINKLVDQGIPREEIAVVTGSTSKEKRKEIADMMNQSKIRVVIGSTATLGVGVNMQENLRAMHHMDAPWMPGELEQRNGRGHRQGNKWNTVYEYRYLTEGIDGRRWQVLAVKQKFITAFLKADEDTRIIEGDAVDVSDGEGIDDISESLSAAAGDPRLLIREKLKGDVNKLENKQRNHDHGIVDAKNTAERLRKANDNLERKIEASSDDSAQVASAKDKDFSITIEGKVYHKRDEANLALKNAFDRAKSAVGTHDVFAVINGFEIVRDKWDSSGVVIHRKGQYHAIATIASIEANLRGIAKSVEKDRQKIDENIQSIARMNDAAKTPFGQAKQLEKKKQLLESLEKDIEMYPVPAPSWLRDGAPVGTDVYLNGDKVTVAGHRWGNDNWFVQVDKGDGDIQAVPYADIMDENNTPVYEARDFVKPEILESSNESIEKPPESVGISTPNGIKVGDNVIDDDDQVYTVDRVIKPANDISRASDWMVEVKDDSGNVNLVSADTLSKVLFSKSGLQSLDAIFESMGRNPAKLAPPEVNNHPQSEVIKAVQDGWHDILAEHGYIETKDGYRDVAGNKIDQPKQILINGRNCA